MKKVFLLLLLLFIIIFSGCSGNQKITEEKAKQMVRDQHSEKPGHVEIKSIFSKSDIYIIEWEIAPIQKGIDSVHQKTGDLKAIESSHGTCRWF